MALLLLRMLPATVLLAVAAGAPEPVQLCACSSDPAAARGLVWDWPTNRSVTGASQPSKIHLRHDPTRCLFAGKVAGRSEARALYVDECSSSAPAFSFVPTMKPLDARDTSVLQSGAACVDAAAMSERLQLYKCIDDDNDQQYAGIDGAGLIVDLWTGFSNCVGVAGPSCAPPRLLARAPAPAPAPNTAAFRQRWCPRYHASKGTDPSGALIMDGETFVFPVSCLPAVSIHPQQLCLESTCLRWRVDRCH
jgi:hypothetical protein